MAVRKQFTPRTADQQALLIRVAKEVLPRRNALDMSRWCPLEDCGTAQCLAGWADTLTEKENKRKVTNYFSERFSSAGKRQLGEEAYAKFYDTNDQVRRWLCKVLREAGEPVPTIGKKKLADLEK